MKKVIPVFILIILATNIEAFELTENEVSGKSCSKEWSRMISNLKSGANAHCKNGVRSFGNFRKEETKQGHSLHFCKVTSNISCK